MPKRPLLLLVALTLTLTAPLAAKGALRATAILAVGGARAGRPCHVEAGIALPVVNRIVSLRGPDIAIIAIYFVMVLGIGIYLKRYAKSGEDFFLAGAK